MKTSAPHRFRKASVGLFLTIFFLISSAFGQMTAAELKAKAESLMNQSKMTEAMPVIEKWIAADPEDPDAHEHMGFALIGLAIHSSDAAEKKDLRIRARTSFIKSKMLGNKKYLVTAMIESLPEDGSEAAPFSADPKSHALTVAGERAFTAGRIDEAIDYYKQAAAADGKNYFAPLFVGDMLIKKDAYAEAEVW